MLQRANVMKLLKERKEAALAENGPGRRMYIHASDAWWHEWQRRAPVLQTACCYNRWSTADATVSIEGEPRLLFHNEDGKTWLDNISQLLDKVAEISELASAYRPLCKHEAVTNKGHETCQHAWRYNDYWASRGQSS